MDERSSDSAPNVDLEQLVAEADTGGRKPTGARRRRSCSGSRSRGRCSSSGMPRRCPSSSASASSTTPRRARSISRFALFLAFTAYPAFKSSPRGYVPTVDWVLALAGAFAAATCSCSTASSRCAPASRPRSDLVDGGRRHRCCCSKPRAARSGCRWCSSPAFFILFTSSPGPTCPRLMQHKGASLVALPRRING